MIKIRVVGPKRLMPSIVSKLHQLKVVHMIDKFDKDISIGKPMANAEQISAALVNARALASQLKVPFPKKSEASGERIGEIIKQINDAKNALNKHNAIIKDSASIIKNNQEIISSLKALKSLNLSVEDFADYERIDYFAGYVRNLQLLKEKLEKKTTGYLLREFKSGNTELMALFIEKKHSTSIKSILAEHSFMPIDIAGLKGSKLNMSLAKSIIEKHSLLKSSGEKQINKIKGQCSEKLPGFERRLFEELEKAEAPLKFGETDEAFLIYGFIPEKDQEKITKALVKHAGSRIFIEKMPLEKDENMPIALDNPSPVDSFQFFLNLYSLPKYGEIDPSWLIAITFPIFFGFMLGDMGYGIVIILLLLWIKKMLPKFSKFMDIIILSAAFTVLFGAVFGEFFGFELYHPLINRNPEHSLQALAIAAIAMGVIHINAGLIAGLINETKLHGFKHAFMEKGGWMLLQIAAGLIAGSYFKIIGLSPLIGYAVAALSIIILLKGEGVRGLVEIPGIFGNILSYLRLMAIGLSSVGLAVVINDISKEMFVEGGFMLIIAILILIIGHTINIALGMLGGFLHSMRLHYVEHFSKFYKGGGIRYEPFGIKKGSEE